MHYHLEEQIPISLPRGTLLVLLEYLANSYECWRKAPGSSDDSSFTLQKPDAGERIALWHLEGAIERTLPEVFSPDYRQLLSEWKQHLEGNQR